MPPPSNKTPGSTRFCRGSHPRSLKTPLPDAPGPHPHTGRGLTGGYDDKKLFWSQLPWTEGTRELREGRVTHRPDRKSLHRGGNQRVKPGAAEGEEGTGGGKGWSRGDVDRSDGTSVVTGDLPHIRSSTPSPRTTGVPDSGEGVVRGSAHPKRVSESPDPRGTRRGPGTGGGRDTNQDP